MAEATSRLKDQCSRWIVQLLGMLPLSVNRVFGGFVGRLSYALNSQLTQTTRTNIQACYPDLGGGPREMLVKQSMIETGRIGAEIAQIWVKPYAWLENKILKVQNGDLLSQALAADSGVVLLLPHLGNWEIFGPYMARLTSMTVLYQPPKLATMETLIRQSRERGGARLVPTNNKGVMALFKTLKAGGTTIILPDQVPAQAAGEFAPFFGMPALTMTLVHGLIQRTDCRVLMGYAKRVKGGFELVFREPDADIYHENTQTSLAAMNRSVEACIEACPSQYQWEYKRFKKRPAGTPKLYD